MERTFESIVIFDTTLRDGEQSPGFSMNPDEKLRMARQLDKLNADVIEVGFPIASEGDFQAVRLIAGEIRRPVIAALARASADDIKRAAQALEPASRPRIHTFIATSDIHLEKKLGLSRTQAVDRAVKAVELALRYVADVEFSAEDATRTGWDFLCRIYEAVIDAGCGTINIADTVGYATPDEFSALVRHVKNNVCNIDRAAISVHCHNDLGLAVANSLAALKAGARQVECTINGIGERAGNASLEEIVMILRTRKALDSADTSIKSRQLYPASRLLRHITGIPVQPNKAIVGANAFSHEAGIHQDGMLKERATYEIMTPESIGLSSNSLVLGKHSGRHAFARRLQALGFDLDPRQLEHAFGAFKALADRKKQIYDEDLESIVFEEVIKIPEKFRLLSVNAVSGTEMEPTATVELEIDGRVEKRTGHGDGPVDAAYKTISGMAGEHGHLVSFRVEALTPETEAMGGVSVHVKDDSSTAVGRGVHTDIVVASAKAYVNALNKIAYKRGKKGS